MSGLASLSRLGLGAVLASILSLSGAFADPAVSPGDEPLLDPGINASSDVMELQAAGPPAADGWSDSALAALRIDLSTSTTGGSAIGYVKLRDNQFNYYQENAPKPFSTYTPPPLYP